MYLQPRLTGHGKEMSRLGGGIGTRGPGETKLETDRRRIGRRIKMLRDDLEGVRSGRALHRRQRDSVPLATLALVGYTNAGKSTLFNRLTNAGVMADARMFATLDPTVRALTLPSRRRVLVSDTVGFIRRLPTTLGEGVSRHAGRSNRSRADPAHYRHRLAARVASNGTRAGCAGGDWSGRDPAITGVEQSRQARHARHRCRCDRAALGWRSRTQNRRPVGRSLGANRAGNGSADRSHRSRCCPFDLLVHARFRFPLDEGANISCFIS